jgi:iron complex outermembrane receptor protein
MRSINPTTRAFDSVADVADVDPLRPQITNTFEIGYKGFFADRFRFGLDLYYSQIENFISPALVVTPNAFLDRATLFAYLLSQMPSDPLRAAALAAAIAGVDGDPRFTGIPLGTVTPIRTVGDPYDVFLSYRNFGEVHLWGSDLGFTVVANDQLSFTATYSFVNRNFIEDMDGIADLALNAPRNKASLAANYRDDRAGLATELRGRWVEAFPVNSGVYIGRVDSYMLMDATVTYALPVSRGTELALAATNLFDNRHREFVGAPEIGRMVFFRVRQSF